MRTVFFNRDLRSWLPWSLLLALLLAAVAGRALAQDAAGVPSEKPTPTAEAAAETPQETEVIPVSVVEEAPPAEEPAPEPVATAAALPSVTDPTVAPEILTLLTVPLTEAELGQAAAAWQGIVKEATAEVVAAQVALTGAAGPEAEAARAQLVEMRAERDALLQRYSIVVDAWAKKGADPAAVEGFRAYRSAIAVEEARTTDFRTYLAQVRSWFLEPDGGLKILIRIAIFLGALFALLTFARFIRTIARQGVSRIPNLSRLLQASIVVVLYWITIAVGLTVVLSILGVDISPVFALIGGASFILAFALQDTLGNLASGVMIMINQPFDEGDYITVAGVSGTVSSLSITSTTVLTPDNQVIVIPNSKVWGDTITNATRSDTRRIDLVFGVSYSDDLEKVHRVLTDILAHEPRVLKEPEPTIAIGDLGDSSVNFLFRPWVKTSDYWGTRWDLVRRVKERFDQEGISIPFPHRSLELIGTTAAMVSAPVGKSAANASAPTHASISRGDDGEQDGDDEAVAE